MPLIQWTKVLDAFEKQNPRGFNYFYHFHYIHGLPECDLSPFERLDEITDYSPEADELKADLERVALSCISPVFSGTVEFSEEGILVKPGQSK